MAGPRCPKCNAAYLVKYTYDWYNEKIKKFEKHTGWKCPLTQICGYEQKG